MKLRETLLLGALVLCLAPEAVGGGSPHGERIEAAAKVHDATFAAYEAGVAPLDDVCRWSVRWYEAMKESGDSGAAAAHLSRMEKLAGVVDARVKTGTAPARDVAAMQYFVAEARVWATAP
ncbi:MAG: hypothetical protein H6737_11230 [Alphaproteobacteria bacterium]|nr:hypothetical protein [Alphaproteobacteria bacterium]